MIPYHLGNLANIPREIEIQIPEPYTLRTILDTLEDLHPVLRGTIRDHSTKQRRPFVRFFACGEDMSHESPDAALPDAVVKGIEPFLIVGAMAGG